MRVLGGLLLAFAETLGVVLLLFFLQCADTLQILAVLLLVGKLVLAERMENEALIQLLIKPNIKKN